MLDLKDYQPLEGYFAGRMWWKCSIIRTTTGLSGKSAIVAVNVPCFISGITQELQTPEQFRIGVPNQFNVIIPARWFNPETGDTIRLEWGADAHIYNDDILFVWGFPYLLTIQSLRNPALLYSHYELICSILPHTFRVFSTPPETYSSFDYIEPPEDILETTLEIVEKLGGGGL